ncbi:MAG: biopolymer transporter ExbD [Gemmatales bacterium]|nr:biopolymer transporter ExbD [Gemmatales bacterium]MCS7159515.1 biopolymer transporter ExbD [Gemmatales bacterium]MDW8174714.1 biopolymer transporter ExbD [Gemmatales bacterium]MDW8222964.1 biopolymer transporter ExbD [Gemmatales bacterium]
MANRRRASGTEMSFDSTAVFITPFLDMAFQILTFFVFTYNPTPMEGQFTIALAAGESGGESKPVTSPQVAPVETKTKPHIIVIARSRPDGKLDALEIIHGSGERIVIKPPATESDVTAEYYIERLHKALVELKKKYTTEKQIVLRGTLRMPWGLAMQLMDACRRYQPEGKTEPEDLFPNVELDLLHQ